MVIHACSMYPYKVANKSCVGVQSWILCIVSHIRHLIEIIHGHGELFPNRKDTGCLPESDVTRIRTHVPMSRSDHHWLWGYAYGLFNLDLDEHRELIQNEMAKRALFQYKDRLSKYGISVIKIRLSSERLIFIIEIPILMRRRFYIATAPSCFSLRTI